VTRDPHRRLREPWIIEAVRTPVGRYGGALASIRPDDLATAVLRAVVARSGIEPGLTEDVSSVRQSPVRQRDVARMATSSRGSRSRSAADRQPPGSAWPSTRGLRHRQSDGDVFIGGGSSR
jgi:hypothetical protein